MSRVPHLSMQGGVYHWRRRVPRHLVDRFGIDEIYRSLKTGDIKLAYIRVRRLTSAADRLFTLAEKRPDITPAHLAAVARDWFRQELHDFELEVASAGPDYGDVDRAIRASAGQEDAANQHALDDLRRNDFSVVSGAARAALAANRIELSDDDPLFGVFCRFLLRAYAELTKLRAARDRGDYTTQPNDSLFKIVEQWAGPLLPAPTPVASTPPAGPLFSEVRDKFLAEKERSKDWRPQVIKQARMTFRLFIEGIGDKPLSSLSRLDVSAFLEMLAKLPRHHGKDGRVKPIKVAIDEGASSSASLLAPKTIKRHMSMLSQFFEYAIGRGAYGSENNPARNLRLPRNKGSTGGKRHPWTADQLHTLFSSPLYTGCRSAKACSYPGKVIPRHSARFWLPLIGAYSGMRLEEIAGLRVSDIQRQGETWFFAVEPHSDRRLKSDAAKRQIPIHRGLVECGFLEHVEKVKRSGVAQLFPELKMGGPDGKFSEAFTRWFPRYRATLRGCDGVDFHGLRHSFKTNLIEKGVTSHTADQLLGHKHAGMDGIYVHAFGLKTLADAVDKVEYAGVSLPSLTRSSPTSLPASPASA